MNLGFTQLRVLLSADDTRGAFALTEQPLEAGALAGPLHSHANEDGGSAIALTSRIFTGSRMPPTAKDPCASAR